MPTTYTYTNLTNGTQYTFVVRANYPDGTTRTSPSSATVIPQATPSGWPNASDTGVAAGTNLTPSGPITTSYNGQIIRGLDITGSVAHPGGGMAAIAVVHTGVVVEDCRITSTGAAAVNCGASGRAGSVTINRCDMIGNQAVGGAVVFTNYTVTNCDIRGFSQGMDANGNCVIDRNYMHDFYADPGTTHEDGIQVEWNDNVTIRNNWIDFQTIDPQANGAIWISAGNPHTGILVENNWVASNAIYCIGCGGRSSAGGIGNVTTIRNNVISNKYGVPDNNLGGYIAWYGGCNVTGNTIYETGEPVTYNGY